MISTISIGLISSQLTSTAKYDEEDDGFLFKRKAAAKPKTKAKAVVSQEEKRSPRRTRLSQSRIDAEATEAQVPIKAPEESQPQKKKANRRLRRSSQTVPENPAPLHTEHASTPSREGTKIFVPISDTPIIKKNKELRQQGQGRRRSSLGLRGRRASSLIDSGHSGKYFEEAKLRS
jgi:kinetochore protein Mis13/DSN1